MTTPLRRADSRAEKIRSLVLKEVDTLSRQPSLVGRKSGTLSKLRPHVEAELEALETLEWVRDLTGEELARRRVFTALLSACGRSKARVGPANERILKALELRGATGSELQELTGASAGTVRNNLSRLIRAGEVVSEGYPKTYRLAPSAPEGAPGGQRKSGMATARKAAG